MRRWIALSLVVLSFAAVASVAQADVFDCDSAACTALSVTFSPFLLTAFVTAAEASGFDGREAFIAAVKDDAADYLASGQASAILEAAFRDIRSGNSEAAELTDVQLASLILGAK